MAILSYAWTTPQFNDCIKTVTRRAWKVTNIARWQAWWDEGKLIHQAWDKVPFAGGEYLGDIKLTKRPYVQPLCDMPQLDLIREGGMCPTIPDFCELVGKRLDDELAVIHFVRVFQTQADMFDVYRRMKPKLAWVDADGEMQLWYQVGDEWELTAVCI